MNNQVDFLSAVQQAGWIPVSAGMTSYLRFGNWLLWFVWKLEI